MKIESDIMWFVQPLGMNLSQYFEEQVSNTLCCRAMYEKYARNEMFTEDLDSLVHRTMRQ